MGLITPANGNISVDNYQISKDRNKYLNGIGVMIESPGIYEHLTAFENLNCLNKFYKKDKKRIGETLDMVGLANHQNKKANKLSTGLKQRLGIAVSLFHNPEYLIWDEPINGLDPEGVFDVRNLVLDLNKQGKTIFLSSHILHELEKICTHVSIINKGKILVEDKLDHILSSVKRTVSYTTDNTSAFVAVCQKVGIDDPTVSDHNNKATLIVNNDFEFSMILKKAIEANINILNIETDLPKLEDLYLNLIKP